MAGSPGTFWVQYETCAAMRMPEICLSRPSTTEIDQILWRVPALVATYLCQPSEECPVNAWLYLRRDPSYSLETLSVTGRRDARRALRSLQFGLLTWPVLLAHGFPAYRDTRRRVGLSDHLWEHFHKRFTRFASHPAHCAIGAWRGDRLVAFMTLIVADDWVAIEGSFSEDHSHTWCPNDGLSHFVLERFLSHGSFTSVSYGLSSVQEADQSGGLHTYKKKVGFEPTPVHRGFVLHPLVRPFGHRVGLWGLNAMGALFPRNRLLKKAGGVLSCVIQTKACDSARGNSAWMP